MTEEGTGLRNVPAFDVATGDHSDNRRTSQQPPASNQWVLIGGGVAVVAVIAVIAVMASGSSGSSASGTVTDAVTGCPTAASYLACDSCDKTGACTLCKPGYALGADPAEPKICGFECLVNTTQSECTTCKDSTTCKACQDGFEIVSGDGDGDGDGGGSNNCEFKCTSAQQQASCTKCSDPNTCVGCMNGFVSKGSFCEFQCSTGQNVEHCLTCESARKCTTCQNDYILAPNAAGDSIHCQYDCTQVGSPCLKCAGKAGSERCLQCADTHTLVNGKCEFICTAEQKAKDCTSCSDAVTCIGCTKSHHVAGAKCEYTCTPAETRIGCRRCSAPGKCKDCLVRWVWSSDYSCKKVTGPSLQEFYTYRATNWQNYDPNGINTASAGGVMRYIHEEVIGLDCCAPQCKRKYEIDRVRRYHITQMTSEGAYKKGRGQFGIFHQYDKAQCTWGGVDGCLKEYQTQGWYVGCQTQHVQNFFYEDSVWLSFPGLCPSKTYDKKTPQCYLDEPGGNCSGCNGNNKDCNGTKWPMGGCVAPNVTACIEKYWGEFDCTFKLEAAGEVFLDELVGIGTFRAPCWPTPCDDPGSYGEWCQQGGIEHYVTNESKSTIPFWKGRKNVELNTQRTYKLLDAFEKKYPTTPFIGEPACEH